MVKPGDLVEIDTYRLMNQWGFMEYGIIWCDNCPQLYSTETVKVFDTFDFGHIEVFVPEFLKEKLGNKFLINNGYYRPIKLAKSIPIHPTKDGASCKKCNDFTYMASGDDFICYPCRENPYR